MPELKLTLPGSIRSKKNSKRIFARGKMKKVLPSKAYEEWEKTARATMFYQLRPLPRLTCPVDVEAHFYFKGPQPDLSGCLESVGDCLEGIVWMDDGQIESWDGSRMHHDKVNPRTEIVVKW